MCVKPMACKSDFIFTNLQTWPSRCTNYSMAMAAAHLELRHFCLHLLIPVCLVTAAPAKPFKQTRI